MNVDNILPKVMRDAGEYTELRTIILMKRAAIGAVVAMLFSGITLAMIKVRSGLDYWQLYSLSLIFYSVPVSIAVSYLRKPSAERRPARARQHLTRVMLLIIAVWSLIGLIILPGLDAATRVVAVSMFLIVVYAHMLPFAVFPKTAALLMAVNVLPLSTQLMFLDEPGTFYFGLCGVVLLVMEMGFISWLHRADMNVIRKHVGAHSAKEPDMSEAGFDARKVFSLHNSSTPSISLQAIAAFFLVIALRSPEHEALLWSWLAAYLGLQALRSCGFMAHIGNPKALSRSAWRAIFAVGVIANQLAWYTLLYLFYDVLDGFNLGIVSGMFMVIGLISTLGLSSDRILLYLNITLCMVPPVAIMFSGEDLWSTLSLGTLAALSMFVVAENIHRSTIFSMKGRLLQQLTEFRANQMQALNEELTEARQRLTEVNTSLESQIQERTRELKHQANHDMLTGLGNRYYFSNLVAEALAGVEDASDGFAVYLLDLDRFKEINDGLGHMAGDSVLRETARRLKEACGEQRACARWGGDEFVILQRYDAGRHDIYQFAEQLVDTLRQPITLDSGEVTVGASIGVAICPEHGATAEELLEHADIAVYRAKCMKEGVSVYNDHWGREAAERLHLAQTLRGAVESGDLRLSLQPFVSTETGAITGFEALARWPQLDGSSISPGVFIPLAEETGLMPLLGEWILHEACSTLQRLAPDSDLRVAVNISVVQLRLPDFVESVRRALAETGLRPERLELEMTESVFAADVESIRRVLTELREAGIRISIDDFGTGYSSISYLRDFPLDTLKIDRSFVADLKEGGDGIFRSIVALAHGLGLSVIVEGVETRGELEKVLNLGGEEVQGYFFSKPIDCGSLGEWLVEHQNHPFNIRRRYLSLRSG